MVLVAKNERRCKASRMLVCALMIERRLGGGDATLRFVHPGGTDFSNSLREVERPWSNIFGSSSRIIASVFNAAIGLLLGLGPLRCRLS